MIWFLMLIRWTLPRFRYDQAMRLGWLGLFPLSILNIVLTGRGAPAREGLSHGVALPESQHSRGSAALEPARPRASASTCVEVLVGLGLTAGHFFANMGGTRCTRLRAQERPRRRHHPVPGGAAALLAAAAEPAPPGAARGRLAALRGLHDVRDRVPRALHLHRGRASTRTPRSRRCPSASTSTSASASSAASAWRPAPRTRSAWTRASWSSRPTAAAGMVYTKEMLLALEPAGPDGVPTLARAHPGRPEPCRDGRCVGASSILAVLAVGSALGRSSSGGTPSTARSSSSSTWQRRGALPHAARGVPRRRPGHRLRGGHHGALRLRDHGADPGQGGDGPRSAARRSAWLARAGGGGAPGPARAGAALARLHGRRAARPPCRAGVGRIGRLLFTDYLFPFEVTSVLLLAAMVGVLALAKRQA